MVEERIGFPVGLYVRFHPFQAFQQFRQDGQQASFGYVVDQYDRMVQCFLVRAVFQFLEISREHCCVQRRQDAGSHSGTVGNLLHLDPVIAQIFYPAVEFTEVIHVVLIYCFILQNKYKRVAFPLHECYINIAL